MNENKKSNTFFIDPLISNHFLGFVFCLQVVIAGAFYPNYFTRARPNPKDYQKEISRDVAGKDPFCSVVFQGFPMEQPGEL